MDLWIWAFIGGLAGTSAMDFGARQLGRLGVNDALGGLLGRWVIGFHRFRLVIDGDEELKIPETHREVTIGTAFHYIVGGGGVALMYPTWFAVTGISLPENHILAGLFFGVLSVGLTWFLQYPCFGFGLFGRKGPRGASTIMPPLLLHSVYGLGIGVVLQLALRQGY